MSAKRRINADKIVEKAIRCLNNQKLSPTVKSVRLNKYNRELHACYGIQI